ncbi:Plastid division protein PDV1 [Apostasia shenzhenica]|uniref:Plastid division protein PDV1 n=1 Tax=Apostasia shenzhenica TaxID=1088818 RepID=A0A2I0ATU1_9ASPA|nr:Plastid division protein PDV1 [Apostasia shenzhenica]
MLRLSSSLLSCFFQFWRHLPFSLFLRCLWVGGSEALIFEVSLMKWEMQMEEIEAVLERIWDLHDKISDAIHAISRDHFLKSIKNLCQTAPDKKQPPPGEVSGGVGYGRCGYVFVKGLKADEEAALAEARSLNVIRTALENLEDQLEFFHTIQSQQQAERDAAIARIEQTRIVLAAKLAEYQGQKHTVIEEAQAFVSVLQDTDHFISPENVYKDPLSCAGDNFGIRTGRGLHSFMHFLVSSFVSARNSISMERIGGVFGNAALFAVSMLALLQLHRVAFNGESPPLSNQSFYKNKNEKDAYRLEFSSQPTELEYFDVFSARG